MRISLIPTFIILFTTAAMAQKTGLTVESHWGEHLQHAKPALSLYNCVYLNSKTYFEYEPFQQESVFYPDIERSQLNAFFFEMDANKSLHPVQDTTTIKSLFLKTDFRTEFSPIIHVDRTDQGLQNGILSSTYTISCKIDDVAYTSAIETTCLYNDWCGVKSTLVADSTLENAVLFTESGLDGIYANVFFISFNRASKKLEITKKAITYSELGMSGTSKISVTNYANKFRFNGQAGTIHCFNIDNDSKLGVAAFLYDIKSKTVVIQSKEFSKDEIAILPEFNEVNIKFYMERNQMNFFINQYRCKISRGKKSNTRLDSGKSPDILFVGINRNETESRVFKGCDKNLDFVFKENDEFLFVFNGHSGYSLKPDNIDNIEAHKFYLTLLHFSQNTESAYSIPLVENTSNNQAFEDVTYLVPSDQSISTGIKLFIYLSGDPYSGSVDYRLGELSIKTN